MHGPIRLVRSREIGQYRNLGPVFEWEDGGARLCIDRVDFRGRPGAVLVYDNPPVHQVATPALHGLLDGLDEVLRQRDGLGYFILYDSNDPLHAGGDLKESLRNLEHTLDIKEKMEAERASGEEIDRLFNWGEARLEKGVALYNKIRRLAQSLRVVAVCGGGLRFGGSAEIPLMADILIGDRRGGMCFSESMIGIIPGWGGIARVLAKAGPLNAETMAKTARVVPAPRLKEIGIYNEVVDIPFDLPRPGKAKGGNPRADEKRVREELDDHNDRSGMILFPRALEIATCPSDEVPGLEGRRNATLASRSEIDREVARRVDPRQYSHIWNRPLSEVREEIERLGRPLAKQSIAAVDGLLLKIDPADFDERQFVVEELRADAALYRDPRFLEGLKAMLEQRVPDFRDPLFRDLQNGVLPSEAKHGKG